MNLYKSLILLIPLFFSLQAYSNTTEVNIEIQISLPNVLFNTDTLDPSYTHRYRMFVNGQYLHTFPTITAANSELVSNTYKSTFSYSGVAPCTSSNDQNFQVSFESDTNSDNLFDYESPQSTVYPLRINCLSIPQNFNLTF